MSVFLLYSNKTSTTGKNLASYLQIPTGNRAPDTRLDFLVRWGSSEKVKLTPRCTYNKRTAILCAVNKLEALRVLADTGVPTPHVTDINCPLPDYLQGYLQGIKFPVLARKSNHQRGTDIILCMQEQDVRRVPEDYSHLVEYIPTIAEYRVHVAFGKTIKTSQKYLNEPTNEFVPWIRNRRTGYVYRKPDNTVNGMAGIRATAVAAIEALGLDFGAVDIIVSESRVPYVLEVNTAPGLIPSGLRKYGEALASKLEITDLDEDYINALQEGEDEETPQDFNETNGPDNTI